MEALFLFAIRFRSIAKDPIFRVLQTVIWYILKIKHKIEGKAKQKAFLLDLFPNLYIQFDLSWVKRLQTRACWKKRHKMWQQRMPCHEPGLLAVFATMSGSARLTESTTTEFLPKKPRATVCSIGVKSWSTWLLLFVLTEMLLSLHFPSGQISTKIRPTIVTGTSSIRRSLTLGWLDTRRTQHAWDYVTPGTLASCGHRSIYSCDRLRMMCLQPSKCQVKVTAEKIQDLQLNRVYPIGHTWPVAKVDVGGPKLKGNDGLLIESNTSSAHFEDKAAHVASPFYDHCIISYRMPTFMLSDNVRHWHIMLSFGWLCHIFRHRIVDE